MDEDIASKGRAYHRQSKDVHCRRDTHHDSKPHAAPATMVSLSAVSVFSCQADEKLGKRNNLHMEGVEEPDAEDDASKRRLRRQATWAARPAYLKDSAGATSRRGVAKRERERERTRERGREIARESVKRASETIEMETLKSDRCPSVQCDQARA